MARIPRRAALVLWPTSVSAAFVGGPLLLSRLGRRHGWRRGRPGAANRLGVPVLAAGSALIAWVLAGHYRSAPAEGWQVGRSRGLGPTTYRPEYLLRSGPYAFSRNPMYVGEDLVLAGWAVLLGSVPVAVAAAAFAGAQSVVLRGEERRLESDFGQPYRDYLATTPRWLGRSRAGPRA